jgi:cytochrome c oxidase subunit II
VAVTIVLVGAASAPPALSSAHAAVSSSASEHGHGLHDVLAPAGPQAAALSHLWWLTLTVCVLVFVAMLAALAYAVSRAPRGTEGIAPDLALIDGSEPRLRRWVTAGVAVSTVLLLGLLVASFFTDRALARLPLADAVHIELTAHQFWWEARYDDADPSRIFTTANELHVPVGRPVVLTLRAADVIHSFWVPSLHGKKDLIPGRHSTLAFRADRAGVYRGQCAEFCGTAHANMLLRLVAEPAEVFERWLASERAPALGPQTGSTADGAAVFAASACVGCHTVRGLSSGVVGPDLTHFGRRATVGAGALPNTLANLTAWILDPPRIKPGAKMPALGLTEAQAHSIAVYLLSLE